MNSPLYDELVPWYHLLDPVEGHEREVTEYDAMLDDAVQGAFVTLLELGAGAGNNGAYFKRKRTCTLTDLSAGMVGLSQHQNPECTHAMGDMRTLRLQQTFDAVMVHDACVYMVTEEDVRQMAQTAFVHTRPGGAALFAPDCTVESFQEFTDDDHNTDGAKTMRYTAWCWQPDPSAGTYRVDYAFLLREGPHMRAVHAFHDEGLFSKATWKRILEDVGYDVQIVRRTFEEDLGDTGYSDEIFLARRALT